jgi:hypothetical protein
MSNPKVTDLIEELSSENVNILRVKILCRENPGLIASAGLRIKIWTLILLGNTSGFNLNKDIPEAEADCEEQQVLDADVPRTRSDVEDFRSTAWRHAVKVILQKFCVSHGVQYKQGMNEVRVFQSTIVGQHHVLNFLSFGYFRFWRLFCTYFLRLMDRCTHIRC